MTENKINSLKILLTMWNTNTLGTYKRRASPPATLFLSNFSATLQPPTILPRSPPTQLFQFSILSWLPMLATDITTETRANPRPELTAPPQSHDPPPRHHRHNAN